MRQQIGILVNFGAELCDKRKALAREVLRGFYYLAAFSLLTMTSWGQPGGPRTAGNPVWPNPDDDLQQTGDLLNRIDRNNSMTQPGMDHPSLRCVLQPYPGLSTTVSVHSLDVPEKTQSEYERACFSLLYNKPAESEKHLRRALQHSQDALGYVMLGKILEGTGRWDEAAKSCTEALVHDPYYWPADLCLAEVSAQQRKWEASIQESDRAASLNPASKKVADYISAYALFNLNQLSRAESRALEAQKLDPDHRLPPMGLLMAALGRAKDNLLNLEIDRIDETVASNDSEQRLDFAHQQVK